MDPVSTIIAGATIITVVGVEAGGVFMLSVLRKRAAFTPVQISLFSAGHAHAGMLIILGLLTLVLLDLAAVGWLAKLAAVGVLVGGPILMPLGFFLSPLGDHRDCPGPLIALTYVGGAIMGLSLLAAGVVLIRSAMKIL